VPAVAVTPDETRPYRRLFLVSFLLLFFELACIRWFGSTVAFLTFFTNIILLATFLGMSVGCLAASSSRDWSAVALPVWLLASALALGTLSQTGLIAVTVGDQAGSPQQVYFGTEYSPQDLSSFVVPIELLAAIFFVLVAIIFVGVGQRMGRAFAEAPDRLAAYIVNITGSLAGIACFAVASYLQTPPLVWFAIVGVVWMRLLSRRSMVQIGCLVAVLVIAGMLSYNTTVSTSVAARGYAVVAWSPYYRIKYEPTPKFIETNNIGHQQMHAVGDAFGYELPHLLNRGAGGGPFEEVLVIGAGSGNDVATALANGARHVDAVEVDPVIYRLGLAEHPNQPYQDPRVTIHIDDGRSFLRQTTRRYDLIVYALVDSLVLHSSYSSLRLESFLFTEQAFDDIAARLKPDGVFAAYNQYRQGWIAGRIARMAQQAFSGPPLVISLPYVDRIQLSDPQADRITFILAGAGSRLDPIRRHFDAAESFWINATLPHTSPVNGFSLRPPAGASDWHRIGSAKIETDAHDTLPTDDWPFLYLRGHLVPGVNLRNMLLLAVLTLAVFDRVAPKSARRMNWQMFFLGAGFMLLETKSVVHMALLFGSTWVVNSIVFFAILVMVLVSNVFVWFVRPTRLLAYFVLLAASLVVNVVVPMTTYLALPGSWRVGVSCMLVFAPIFFAGIVFGALFSRSEHPEVDFGSNIAGAMLGGFAESLALIVGFTYLVVLAIAFYLCSAALGARSINKMPNVL